MSKFCLFCFCFLFAGCSTVVLVHPPESIANDWKDLQDSSGSWARGVFLQPSAVTVDVAQGEEVGISFSLKQRLGKTGDYSIEVIPKRQDDIAGYKSPIVDVTMARNQSEYAYDAYDGISPNAPLGNGQEKEMVSVPRQLVKDNRVEIGDGWNDLTSGFGILEGRQTYLGREYKAVRPIVGVLPEMKRLRMQFYLFLPFNTTPDSLADNIPYDGDFHTQQLLKFQIRKVVDGTPRESWLSLTLNKDRQESDFFLTWNFSGNQVFVRQARCGEQNLLSGLDLDRFMDDGQWYSPWIELTSEEIQFSMDSANANATCTISLDDLDTNLRAAVQNSLRDILAGGDGAVQFGDTGIRAPHAHFSEFELSYHLEEDSVRPDATPLFLTFTGPEDFRAFQNSSYRGLIVNSTYAPPQMPRELAFDLPTGGFRTFFINIQRPRDEQYSGPDCVLDIPIGQCRGGFDDYDVQLVQGESRTSLFRLGVRTASWSLAKSSQHGRTFMAHVGEVSGPDFNLSRFTADMTMASRIGFNSLNVSTVMTYGETLSLSSGASKLRLLEDLDLINPLVIRSLRYGQNQLNLFINAHSNILPPASTKNFMFFGVDEFHRFPWKNHLSAIYTFKNSLDALGARSLASKGKVFGTTVFEFLPKVFDVQAECIIDSGGDPKLDVTRPECAAYIGEPGRVYPLPAPSLVQENLKDQLETDYAERVPRSTAVIGQTDVIESLIDGDQPATYRDVDRIYGHFLHQPAFNTSYFHSCSSWNNVVRRGPLTAENLYQVVEARRNHFRSRRPYDSFLEFEPERYPIDRQGGKLDRDYIYWQSYEFFPLLNRYMAGIFSFSSHFSGFYAFSYYRNPQRDPYASVVDSELPASEERLFEDRVDRDMLLVYPSASGPVRTLASESLRAGITDYLYFSTLDLILSDRYRRFQCTRFLNSGECQRVLALRSEFLNLLDDARFRDPLFFDDRYHGRYHDLIRSPNRAPELTNNCRGDTRGLDPVDYHELRSRIMGLITRAHTL